MGSPLPTGLRWETLPLSRGSNRWDAVVAAADLAATASIPLSAAEQALHDSFPAPRRRQTFRLGRIAAKAAVQAWLGDDIARFPEILPGVFQQPVVIGSHHRPVDVSIAHVDDRAVAVAHAAGHPLGIDLERLQPESLDALRHALSPAEWTWARDAGENTVAVATVLWGAKEALGKVLRCGFTAPIEVLAVDTLAATPPDAWTGTFHNFPQYRFHAWRVAGHVLTLVLPRNTAFEDAPDPGRWRRLLGVPGY